MGAHVCSARRCQNTVSDLLDLELLVGGCDPPDWGPLESRMIRLFLSTRTCPVARVQILTPLPPCSLVITAPYLVDCFSVEWSLDGAWAGACCVHHSDLTYHSGDPQPSSACRPEPPHPVGFLLCVGTEIMVHCSLEFMMFSSPA